MANVDKLKKLMSEYKKLTEHPVKMVDGGPVISLDDRKEKLRTLLSGAGYDPVTVEKMVANSFAASNPAPATPTSPSGPISADPYQNTAKILTGGGPSSNPQGFSDGSTNVQPSLADELSQEQYIQSQIAPQEQVGELPQTDIDSSRGPYQNELNQLSTGKEERDAQLASGFDPNSLLDEKNEEVPSKPMTPEEALAAADQRKEDVKNADIPLSKDDESDKDESKPEDETNSFSRLIAALKPQQNDLKEAQRQRDMNIAGQNISKGAALLYSGISGANPDTALGIVKDNDKYVSLPVQKYEEQIANQKNDPNSNMSDAYRQLYTKVTGQTAPETWSAADLEKVSPLFEKFIQARESAQAKKDIAIQNLQYKQDRAKELDELRKQGLISQDQFRKALIELKGQQVGQAGQRIGFSVEKSIQQDPTIKKANDRINSADSAITQLNDRSQPLTNARLNAIQIDLANTLNFMSSQGASDYKAKSDKLTNLNTRLADLKQKYGTSLVDLRKEAPEVYKEVLTYAQSVKDSVQKIKDNQDKNLRKQYGTALGENSDTASRIDAGGKQEPDQSGQSNEIPRLDPKTGKTAIFDANTKKFIRWQ